VVGVPTRFYPRLSSLHPILSNNTLQGIYWYQLIIKGSKKGVLVVNMGIIRGGITDITIIQYFQYKYIIEN
tara:strand:- start:631 stop:843 length:213 start_codon:yes stop_codon:yes gene_type:complete